MKVSAISTICWCILFLDLGNARAAECDLTIFDKTSPAALKADVQAGNFQWASDVDVQSGQTWLYNYIWNTAENENWSGHWPKAFISQSTIHPLPPGKITCQRYPINGYAEEPDTNAPIYYGNIEREQPAAVYVQKNTAVTTTASIEVATTIDSPQGGLLSIEATVELSQNISGEYRLSIDTSPKDLLVGFQDYFAAFVPDHLDAIIAEASLSGTKAAFLHISELPDPEVTRKLIASNGDDKLMILRGSLTVNLGKQRASDKSISTNLVIFDPAMHPILATAIQLPLFE